MPSTTLWQTRIAFVFGIAMGLFGLLAAGTIAFHEQLGIAACGASKSF